MSDFFSVSLCGCACVFVLQIYCLRNVLSEVFEIYLAACLARIYVLLVIVLAVLFYFGNKLANEKRKKKDTQSLSCAKVSLASYLSSVCESVCLSDRPSVRLSVRRPKTCTKALQSVETKVSKSLHRRCS